MAEWGVKEAAQRLAKLLGAKGRKCEVGEGEGDWPVVLVVDGTMVKMRQHELRIARGMAGDPVKNVFDVGYAIEYTMISRTGKVNLAWVEEIISRRKEDDAAEAMIEECRKRVDPIIAAHPNIIHPLGSGAGGKNASTTGRVKVRLGDKHTGTTMLGKLNIFVDITFYDAEVEDLKAILDAIETIKQQQNERIKAKGLKHE